MEKIRITCKGQKYLPISELKNFQNDLKKLDKENLEKLKRSILKYGFSFPVFIWGKSILDGHQRIFATSELLKQGYRIGDIPIVEIQAANEKEAAEKLLMLNSRYAKITEDGLEHFIENFGLNLEDLVSDVEIPEIDLEAFLEDLSNGGEGKEAIEDEIPEVPDEAAVIKPGDLWILGSHRLLCGDSTKKEDVIRLFNGLYPILMITDPPYGVCYDPKWREERNLGTIRSTGKVQNDDIIDWSLSYQLFPGDIGYIWHAGKYAQIVSKNLEDCGFEIVSQIIWGKQHFVLSRGDYHWQHEPCWYVVRKGKNHNWQGARDQSTLWEIRNNSAIGNPSEKEETWGHGTQKPVECMERPIRNNSQRGDVIYDPFGGSGTTLIACEKTQRKCLMIEIDPKYCDVIVARWEKYSGKKAILE